MNDQFDLKTIPCLSCTEAALRLKQEGFNEIPTSSQRNFLTLVLCTLREPMFLLLLIGALLYFILGNKEEALLLFGFVLVIIGITIHQERKSERALAALRDLSSPRAFVIRDGQGMRIAGREVVRGDVIVVNEGDRVPADAMLISSTNLLVDEAILTGESFPVRKNPRVDGSFHSESGDDHAQAELLSLCSDPAIPQPGGEDLPFIYSSTHVVQGKAIAKVLAVGPATVIGKIGENLAGLETEATPLQKETHVLVRNFAVWGFFFCILVAVAYGITRNDWLHGFLAGISLAMAVLPEELPVILMVFLALGAWRISLKHVLTRRTPAIEALGAATVLCVDKTGTITQNCMVVKKLWVKEQFYDVNVGILAQPIPEEFHTLIEFAILASQRDPFDPMEIAIKALGNQYLKDTEHLHNNWKLAHQYPLSKELLAISLVWESSVNSHYTIAAKGAPETIFDLCHLSNEQIAHFSQQVQQIAGNGLRVLGVAKAKFQHAELLPDGQHAFEFEFLGLVGLADPVRPRVFDAVQSCYQAGIRVIMITGDYVGTAQNIARQIGLNSFDSFITGADLANMSDLELERRIKFTNIFARILPEQKLRIVNALKSNGEVVAMTGDGVNDAPALKAANIGIAMGERGTDVARESADLVLLDDDFSSIVSAIKLGRRIFDNIKKAVTYTIAVHLPIIGMSLVPILFKWPLVLLPAHIVFLELIIDPTCSIVFEAEEEEKDVMRRLPRSPKEKLFNRKTVVFGLVQGLAIFCVVFAVFFVTKQLDYPEKIVRTMSFATLVFTNLALILANRSRSLSLFKSLFVRNSALWWVISGSTTLLLGVLYVPFLQNLFHFQSLALLNLSACFGVGIATVFLLRWLAKMKWRFKTSDC